MTFLADILTATRRRVGECRSRANLGQLEKEAAAHRPRGFRKRLEASSRADAAVIAELKKASPSRGLIRSDFEVASLARELENSGAAALSVVTEEEYFSGSLENLKLASTSTQLACLRKDFIVDEFQLVEARASGADAVLLITAALAQEELIALARRAAALELDVLCEVHDEEELGRALDAGCELIGVNSRDLKTFKVDLATAFRIAQMLPHGVTAVAESGLESGADIARLRAAGYDAFLIGESLMRAPSPGAALSSLLVQARAAGTGA